MMMDDPIQELRGINLSLERRIMRLEKQRLFWKCLKWLGLVIMAAGVAYLVIVIIAASVLFWSMVDLGEKNGTTTTQLEETEGKNRARDCEIGGAGGETPP